MEVTGSGDHAGLRVLLPDGWSAVSVEIDGEPVPFQPSTVGDSTYVDVLVTLAGAVTVVVRCT